ncbi:MULTISPECIES: BrnA antitoxin family protein [unclassified Azospirillum]|uniref:BrnA antitoxin family protein n=1 Tax=unclassified Azospirillum TaxID=2630922 RepID=UPI000B73C229|nr:MULTISPECIES: BrnA antitoxin family protein [unclassified Azospirillum]SNS48579.1 BrnA antitoxin of type II toxin-antitoxin system [Azospirillum sp. RU38E]SNS67730.1 BrnA antitoxin of type II toxin-antitoxin system [Azospirillum sp. RU37A]
MTASNELLDPTWIDPDDAPDLSTPEWQVKFAEARARKGGRPKSPAPKVALTLRLDPAVVDHFRATGPGWQSRINETLRKAAGL